MSPTNRATSLRRNNTIALLTHYLKKPIKKIVLIWMVKCGLRGVVCMSNRPNKR